MTNPVFLEPVSDDSPCGEDMRWDPVFIQFMQDFDATRGGDDQGVLDAEMASGGGPDKTLEEVLEEAVELSGKTKDLRILSVYVEGSWILGGLGAFADAMEDLVCVIEKWPNPDEGVHPRADEDDGDLSERMAPLGKLLKQIPILAGAVGWGGKQPEISERSRIAEVLKGVFNSWSQRVGPAFNDDSPSSIEAWRAVKKLTEEAGGAAVVSVAQASEDGTVVTAATGADTWDLVDQAAEAMANQDRHSPALPVLRLLGTWRSLNIMEIADNMKASGVSLEQLLDSIKKQMSSSSPGGPGGQPSPARPGSPPPGGIVPIPKPQ